MFSYNIFRQGGDVLLAICDKDILGSTFRGGDIEITVSEFYKGGTCGPKEIIGIAKESTIINAVGNRIVDLLIDNKLVEKDSVLKIGAVRHAQVVVIS